MRVIIDVDGESTAAMARGLGTEADRVYNEELDSSSGCDMSFECSTENTDVLSPPRSELQCRLERSLSRSRIPCRVGYSPSHVPRRLELSPPKNYLMPTISLATPRSLVPRRLDLSPKKMRGYPKMSDDENKQPQFKNHSLSPPYKRVRALRLFDNPLTPKTILEKSSAQTPLPRQCLFENEDKPKGVACAYDKPSANVNPFTPNGEFVFVCS